MSFFLVVDKSMSDHKITIIPNKKVVVSLLNLTVFFPYNWSVSVVVTGCLVYSIHRTMELMSLDNSLTIGKGWE